MGGQVQPGWARLSVNVLLYVEVVGKNDSGGAFTGVSELFSLSGGALTSPQESNKDTRKVGTLDV